MPFRPEHSLLRVEVPALHTIDTTSVENLFGMWSLFSKTSHAMEDGKRLENLSWRLWNRETLLGVTEPSSLPTSTHDATSSRRSYRPQSRMAATRLPELSSSLDSVSSSEQECSRTSHIPKGRPELRRNASGTSTQSRGSVKHTPIDLEKMVISIKENKLEPIELPVSAQTSKAKDPPSTNTSQVLTKFDLTPSQSPLQYQGRGPRPTDSQATIESQTTHLESSASTVDTNGSHGSNDSTPSQPVGSQDSSSTEMSTHSIVRGFVPGGAPSSYRSQTNLASTQPTPILKTSPTYRPAMPKKKAPMFTIGTSSGEDESSLDSHMHRSALAESLRNKSSLHSDSSSKKQTSFNDKVSVGKAATAAARHSPVFESDDEDDEVSESAIEDDDDSSDWEDSDEGSGPSSVNESALFQRVDSRPNLTSRRSLLTTLMHEPDRARALQNEASRSTPAIRRTGTSRKTTPNGPSVATSPAEHGSHLQLPGQMTQAKPIIMTTSNTQPRPTLALSPRTTRRNMLSTELTESLRKNLLWERQHKSTGNLAALKRRHTSHDVKNLKQQPEPGPVMSQQADRSNFNNDYFHAGLGEYHAKGW